MPPVTVSITRIVKRGCEGAFETALHDFISHSLDEPGQLGVLVLRPAPGSDSREYGLLRRFVDEAARDAFYQSPLFAEWKQKVAELVDREPRYEHLSGLETWFTLPGRRSVTPPPRWKMALVTTAGVWPASMLVPWLFAPLMQGLPSALQALLTAVGIVVLLTWAIMPMLVTIRKRWL